MYNKIYALLIVAAAVYLYTKGYIMPDTAVQSTFILPILSYLEDIKENIKK